MKIGSREREGERAGKGRDAAKREGGDRGSGVETGERGICGTIGSKEGLSREGYRAVEEREEENLLFF